MEGMEGSLDETMPGMTPEPAAPTRPARRASKANRLGEALGLAVLLLGPLFFFRAPWPLLLQAQLLLTEGGHWLAPLLLVLCYRAPRRRSRAVALAASLLLFSPLLRAAWQAPLLRAQTGLAWGQAAAKRQPLRFWRLYAPGRSAGVERHSEAFDGAHGLSLTLWAQKDDQGLMTARPVVLVLHGGGWDGGSRDEHGAFNTAIARLGWVVADIDYRLAPSAPWPAQREDIMRALEHLRLNAKRLDVDPGHVVLLGRSSGAHLALDFAYGTQDPAIRGVIGFYGPADLRFAWQRGAKGAVLDSLPQLRGLCGDEPRTKGGCFDEASPYLQVNAGSPPTLLLHGRLDPLIAPAQSARLAQRLREQGVQHQWVDLPWATHRFDRDLRSPGGQAAFYTVERFLIHSERAKPLKHL